MKTSTNLVRSFGIISALSCLSFGCSASSGAGSDTPASTQEPSKAPASEESAGKTAQLSENPELLFTLSDAGFAEPEAIIYDADADVYFVSNVNGDPLAEDGNGFISKVGSDGKVQELKWIDGQKKGGTLNAPKGMAVSKGFLYVSDITWIRIFDRKTGEAKGKIFAKGATFLNGVTTNAEGEIAFSDTGWKSGKDGFASTGSDAVYRVDPATVAAKELTRGKELGNPNGLAATKDGLWVVNEEGELFLVGKDGKKEQTTQVPMGGLDGVVALDDGRFLVSSWKANAIYEGKPGGEFRVLLSDLKSPASIGFDAKRGRILVPKMLENQVLIYSLSGKAAAEPAPNPEVASEASAPEASTPAEKGQEPVPVAKPSPAAPNKAGEAKTEPSKAPPSKAAPANPPLSKAEPIKAPASKTEPSKTPPSKTEPPKAPPAKIEQPASPSKAAAPANPAAPARK